MRENSQGRKRRLFLLAVFSLTCCVLFYAKWNKSGSTRSRSNNGAFVAIITCSKSGHDWMDVKATSLSTLLIPSLAKSLTSSEKKKHRIELLVGYDEDDAFWTSETNRRTVTSSYHTVPISFISIQRRVGRKRIPFNELAQAAFEYGADYIARVNDDTAFASSGWITIAINRLYSFQPPNVGVVGPLCEGGSKRPILTHDMVHSTHFQIFKTYYPAELDNWWVDDWITHVYAPKRTALLSSWMVRHHTEIHGTRYLVNSSQEGMLSGLIERDRQVLEKYLHTLEPSGLTVGYASHFQSGIVQARSGPILGISTHV